MSETRKLATILFADIAGYTALMQKDEQQALHYLNQFKEVLEQETVNHRGQIVQYFGDGCLLAFDSSVEGVQCALALQKSFTGASKVPVRIGIHLGDVVFKNNNVFGDGVNVASRVESLGIPGAILLSKTVRDQIKNQSEFKLQSLGSFDFKNVEESMEVFAVSNSGLAVPKREEMQGKLKSVRSKPRPKWMIPVSLIGLLVVAISAWLLGSSRGQNNQSSAIQSMAVLPFLNTSSNPDLEYLTEGIAENLIAKLSSTSDVRVISRFSSFPLRDSMHNLSYIIKLLGVDAILVGDLNMEAEDLVLDTELVAGSDHSRLWSANIRGSINGISEMEEEVASAILTSIQPDQAAKISIVKEVDPKAYQHYMQGRFLSYGSSQREMDLAIEHFHKAIEIDPQYAEAYAALANQKSGQARFSNTSRQELLREARLALQSAFAINPELPEAHQAEANIRFFCDFDWSGADESFRRALSADPKNASILADYSFFQCAMNRYDNALDLAEQAIELDPISISSMHIIAWSQLYNHPDKAVESFKRITELHPNWIWGYMKQGMAEILVGDCDAAVNSFQGVSERKGEWGGELLESYLAVLYHKCGLVEKAKEQKEFVLSHLKAQGNSDPLNIAILHGGLGDIEQMISWAKKCIEEKSVNVALMQLVKDLDLFIDNPLQHPSYQNLLKELNFPGV